MLLRLQKQHLAPSEVGVLKPILEMSWGFGVTINKDFDLWLRLCHKSKFSLSWRVLLLTFADYIEKGAASGDRGGFLRSWTRPSIFGK